MGFWDTIGSANFKAAYVSLPQNTVAGFCADAQNLAHLLDIQNIRIVLQHDLIGISLRNGRYGTHLIHLIAWIYPLRVGAPLVHVLPGTKIVPHFISLIKKTK